MAARKTHDLAVVVREYTDREGNTKKQWQTIGADGSGEFAIVSHGTAEFAAQWAKDFLRNVEASGARLGRVVFVAADECYAGNTVMVVTPNTNSIQ